MAYSDINAFINAQVDTDLAGSYSIQHDNEEGFAKPNGAVYLRSFIRQSGSEPIGIETGVRYRLNGTLEFQVLGPIGTDQDDVDAGVDAIISAFQYKRYLVGDPENSVVRFQNPSPIPQGRVNGTYQVNVTIRFWVDLIS